MASKGSGSTGKGMYSFPDGHGSNAARVAPMCGPGGNADQQKANRLLQKARKNDESLRGKSGM